MNLIAPDKAAKMAAIQNNPLLVLGVAYTKAQSREKFGCQASSIQ
jgi:hypothetical protein